MTSRTSDENTHKYLSDIEIPTNRIIGELTILTQKVAEVKTDMHWIKKSIEKIDKQLTTCRACVGSEYIYNNINSNNTRLTSLEDDISKIKTVSKLFLPNELRMN